MRGLRAPLLLLLAAAACCCVSADEYSHKYVVGDAVRLWVNKVGAAAPPGGGATSLPQVCCLPAACAAAGREPALDRAPTHLRALGRPVQ